MWRQIKSDEVIPKLKDGACILAADLVNMSVDNAGDLTIYMFIDCLKSSDCLFFEKVKDERKE